VDVWYVLAGAEMPRPLTTAGLGVDLLQLVVVGESQQQKHDTGQLTLL
jgi:hypothetical protein